MNASVPQDVMQEASSGARHLQLQVCGIRRQAEGIHAFELVHPDGEPLPTVDAGAHVDVHLPGGLIRSYSLAGDPGDRTRWLLGVLRETQGRGGSRAMHDSVRVGDLITVSAPRNAFALAKEATRTLLLAGGIGITPLKAMAHVLARQGRAFELHYCARTPRHAAFADELRRLVPAPDLHFHFDEGDPSQGLDIARLLHDVQDGTHVYYCGPAGFMRACADACAHWPQGTVHCEHFKAPAPVAAGDPGGAFTVEIASTGQRLPIPTGTSIATALKAAGIPLNTSCEAGLCATCKVRYLSGEVDHQDYILDDGEKQHYLTACVSRAKSELLVLDL